MLKILNRLEEEQIIRAVSKGVYYIGNKTFDEDTIISKYTNNGQGMIIGYSLFNSIGLTSHQEDKIELINNHTWKEQ